MSDTAIISGRCYCGRTRLQASAKPLSVTYCHCSDCRRLSGAPVSAFAAFSPDVLQITPNPDPAAPVSPGVTRRFCPDCGTQLSATYDYLPNQVYVPIGLLDQAADLPPNSHSHVASALPWHPITDELPRDAGSGRDRLNFL